MGRFRTLACLVSALALAGTAITFVGLPADAASTSPGPVTQIAPPTGDNQQEPSVAINPTNPRNLVAGSIDGAGGGQCAVYNSNDRGNTWTPGILGLAAGFTNAGDPVVDFAADGTAYFLCMNTAAGNSELGQYVYSSTDGGTNWSAPVLAIARVAGDRDDKGHIVVDDRPGSPYLGNVYVAATRLSDNPPEVHFARSVDQGASFVDQQIINDTDIGFAVNLAVGADGAVYAAWSRENPAAPGVSTAIMIDKSTDGGMTFGALAGGTDQFIQVGGIVAGGVRAMPGRGNGAPYIATHPTDPNIVYAVWAEQPAGIDDSDIRFSRSTDGGNTWSPSVRLNTDANPPGEYFSQFWPTMSVDPVTGEIDVIWYSDQNDANRSDATPLIDIYFTSSSDAGASFAAPQRVTPTPSTPSGFFGDYLGIDSFGGVAHPVWVDTTVGTNQDIATAQIGAADVEITKVDGVDPAVAGTSLDYTLTVTNNGPADATQVVVTDALPAGVQWTAAGVPCVESPPNTLTCELGTVPSGAAASFAITGDIDPGLVHDAGGTVSLTNSATVSLHQDDPVPGNNTVAETTEVVAMTDVAVTAFDVPAAPVAALIGDPTPFTVRTEMVNYGPSSPVDIGLTATAAAGPGIVVAPVAAVSTVSDVAQGEVRQSEELFTFTCVAPGPHTITLGSEILPIDPATTDPDQTDNVASAGIVVDCVVPVVLNIKPGSSTNPVNPKSRQIPVGVLTTAPGDYGLPVTFDATTIDVSTVRFGTSDLLAAGVGAEERHNKGHPEDVVELDERHRDGDLDLKLHFATADAGVSTTTTELCIVGTFSSGNDTFTFTGCDVVTIRP